MLSPYDNWLIGCWGGGAQDFCQRKGFNDYIIVYETKLLVFLEEEVFHRGLRTNNRRPPKHTAGGEEIPQTLSWSGVDSYVFAVMDLYKEQVSLGNNTHPHPRGAMLRTVLDCRKKGESKRKKEEYIDRGAGTLMEEYTDEITEKLVRASWTAWGKNPKSTFQTIHSFLRTGCDFLIAHHMLLRGESRRRAELPDLFCLELKNEGSTPCQALVLLKDNGKTNQTDRTEYTAIARHKDIFLCSQSALAFYLFHRWDIVREAVPTFQQNQDWYNIKLFPGGSSTKELSYETHLKWTNELFNADDFHSLKKTHLGREKGSRKSNELGVEEGQIRRAEH